MRSNNEEYRDNMLQLYVPDASWGYDYNHAGLDVGLGGMLDLPRPAQSQQKQEEQLGDNDSYEDSTDSDLPPEKRKLSAAFRPRGKKKRNKCTPEQLRSLEAFFDKNRNPTGRVRQELSRKLRMPERSVQVWFQNRRAKVKTLVRRGEEPVKPEGHKEEEETEVAEPSVRALPTSALCVGTWRRVSPLICFFSRRLQSLTWYLTSESIGFKLEIPWTSIRGAYFDGPWTPSVAERAEGVTMPLGRFVVELERPPTFFMEVFRSCGDKTSWRQCEDFTEHRQATTNGRHVLNGPYDELRAAVLSLSQSNDELAKMIEFRDSSRAGPSISAESWNMFREFDSPASVATSLVSEHSAHSGVSDPSFDSMGWASTRSVDLGGLRLGDGSLRLTDGGCEGRADNWDLLQGVYSNNEEYGVAQRLLDEDLFPGATPTARSFPHDFAGPAIHPELQARGRSDTLRQ